MSLIGTSSYTSQVRTYCIGIIPFLRPYMDSNVQYFLQLPVNHFGDPSEPLLFTVDDCRHSSAWYS